MAAHAIYQNDLIRDLVVEAVSSLDSGKQTIDKLLTIDKAFFASAVKSRWSEIREDRLSKCKNTGCPEERLAVYAAAVRTVKIGLQPDITKIDIKSYRQSFPNVRFIQTDVVAKEARRPWIHGTCRGSLRASIKVNCMPHELELSGEDVDDLAIRISDPRLGLTGPQPSFRLVSLQFGPPTVPLQENSYMRDRLRDSSTSTFLIARSDASQDIKSKLDEKDESMELDVLRSTASDDLYLFGYIRHLHLLDVASTTYWLRRLITCTCHLKSLAVIAIGGRDHVSLWTALAPSVNTLESIQLYGDSSYAEDGAWRFDKEFVGHFDNKRLNFIRGNFDFEAAIEIQRKIIPPRTNPSSPIRRVELYIEKQVRWSNIPYSTFPLVLGAVLTEIFHADCRLINQEVQSSRDDMIYPLDWAEAQSSTRSVSSALYLRRIFLKLIRKRLTPGFKNVNSTDHQSDGDDSDSSEVFAHSSDMGSDAFDD